MIELSTTFFTPVCITNICVSFSSNVIITLGQNYTTCGGGGGHEWVDRLVNLIILHFLQ